MLNLYTCLKLCFCSIMVNIEIQTVSSMSLINKQSYFMDNGGAESEVADFIVNKGYLPKDKDLPKTSLIKNMDNDVTYLLSKLSNEELIRLLNDQPKKNVYEINDIVKVALDPMEPKALQENKFLLNLDPPKASDLKVYDTSDGPDKRFRTVSEKDKPQAFFKLDNKEVEPFSTKTDADPNYAALQKINNLLYSRPLEETGEKSSEDDEKRELLFDVLVNQLKALCCKRGKTTKKGNVKKFQYKSLLNDLIPQQDAIFAQITNDKKPNEYMFLIINDEIKSNASDEIISVDPESLARNSSVLLLGPITTPLTDNQLKSVMTRISTELSKPDYLPLLQQLSDGTLSDNKIRLMKSLVSGPETRRYIKPHRCNHQSPLAKIYGGPKWIICTGYLNINTPSLYDR